MSEVNPEVNLTHEKFMIQADEYLSHLEEYKKIDKMMKQYESNIKSYMVDNDIDVYKNEKGRITIDYVKVNCLNRALIKDIHQYYEEITRITMRKTVSVSKPVKPRKEPTARRPVGRPRKGRKVLRLEGEEEELPIKEQEFQKLLQELTEEANTKFDLEALLIPFPTINAEAFEDNKL